MSGQSLGLIETVGLAGAVEAADAAMKAANVELVGYELTKGGGLVTVKLTGEVGAMNAAVAAGVASAGKMCDVYAWKVIARAAAGIDQLIHSSQADAATNAASEPAAEQTPEPKTTRIPVATLEPDDIDTDCAALCDDVTDDEPLTPPPSSAPKASAPAASTPKTPTDVAAKAPATNAPKEKQPARPRAKPTRK